MKARFPGKILDFYIVLEGLLGGRAYEEFHLHGAIELPGPEFEVDFDHTDDVAKALRAAGGDVGKELRARQVKFKPLYDPIGWAAYTSKHRLCVANALVFARRLEGLKPYPRTESLIAATDNLRARGKAWFQESKETGSIFRVVAPRGPA